MPLPLPRLNLPHALPLWSLLLPLLGLLALGLAGRFDGAWTLAAATLGLIAAVIEVALVVSLLLAGGAQAAALPRDTVFAAIMIVTNGVVGLCLLLGGLRHRVVAFRVDGTGPTLAVLLALSVLTLVLPGYTTTTPGPTFSPAQLALAGVASLLLYGAFVFVQTVRHRDYFLPLADEDGTAPSSREHAAPPSSAAALAGLALLMVSLLAVVGLAKA